MAHDFGAENLEDGEQWLPSDFFSLDEVHASNKISTPLSYSSSSSKPNPSCMDSFHHFSASTSLHRQFHKPLPNSQRFEPAVVCGSTDPCECRTGNSWTGCSPVYRSQRVNPVQTHIDPNVIESFIGERAWALRHQRIRSNPNRVLPAAGTGVFLPRTSSNFTKHNIHASVGKEPRNMNRHEFQLPPRKILLNTQQEVCDSYPSADEVRMPNNSNY